MPAANKLSCLILPCKFSELIVWVNILAYAAMIVGCQVLGIEVLVTVSWNICVWKTSSGKMYRCDCENNFWFKIYKKIWFLPLEKTVIGAYSYVIQPVSQVGGAPKPGLAEPEGKGWTLKVSSRKKKASKKLVVFSSMFGREEDSKCISDRVPKRQQSMFRRCWKTQAGPQSVLVLRAF